MNISELDSNLKIETEIKEKDLVWFDVRREPFTVYGLYHYKLEDAFRRMPPEIAKQTNEGVCHLNEYTAGGRVRFSTDSPFIAIKAVMPNYDHMPHMTLLGSAGFDLFEKKGAAYVYTKSFMPMGMKGGYESLQKLPGSRMRDLTLNFPLYSPVKNLYIGLKAGCTLTEGANYTYQKPVVYYGSSITQGGCASKPGNAYQAFISRRYDADFINLGFSGSGRAEDVIVDYMSTLDMSVFVSDYDHNAPTAAYLEATHRKMYEKIRAAQPELPYVMISRPNFLTDIDDAAERRRIIHETYVHAKQNGDQNVYYIDGESLFAGADADACTVDGTHPNDLGFWRMADVIGPVVGKLLEQ